jgi:hypothetical protein
MNDYTVCFDLPARDVFGFEFDPRRVTHKIRARSIDGAIKTMLDAYSITVAELVYASRDCE